MSASRYAAGKNAHGFCDRCGFRVLLASLRLEYVQGRATGVRTCPSCFDADHPQNWLGRYPVMDSQALRNPRPDPALAASRGNNGGSGFWLMSGGRWSDSGQWQDASSWSDS